MDLWYTEYHTENVRFSIRVKQQLYSGTSDFQTIDVFDTFEFGRVLVLDGVLMLTEKDEFIYHEMMTHLPLSVNCDVRRVLVIGAGDGGTVRELCKYSLEHIDMVEIDKQVTDVCREYLQQTACCLDNANVNIYYEDGLKFVRGAQNEYDLIIVDSTDPFGPGEGLFTREFYGNCFKALREGGILVNQMENPYYKNDIEAAKRAYGNLSSSFPIVSVYQAHIPTYPSGHWLFGYAAKLHNPLQLDSRWDSFNVSTRYYNKELHVGSFALPNYAREMFK